MKKLVYISKKAAYTIVMSLLDADNNHETGGVLIGYRLGQIYFVVAVTTSNSNSKNSRVSFLLDGAEHTQKVNDLISDSLLSPSVLGIWHSHICDGHQFSAQDRISNNILAQTLGGALSMLVTKPAHTALFSASYISKAGNEEDCLIRFQINTKLEVSSYEWE